jgi:3-dehydroquinate synthase
VVTVRVPLISERDASYDILIGRGLLADLARLVARHCPARRYAVISDSHVAELYGPRVLQALREGGLDAELYAFPAGEWNKTRDTWASLSDRMLVAQLGRDTAVLALGGGVTGDVAGFVAATYYRGLPFAQLPTTLLAMIDSSIGGKTGVDTPHGKNLLGAFHQPRVVIADLDTLTTLAAPQLAAGMAEAIKHGVIADADYCTALERDRDAVMAPQRDAAALERVVTRSVEIKAAVVAADEREGGRRAWLNFGHTIGHAVEATNGYTMLHGEAIAIGMALESALAERVGVAERGTGAGIVRLLERFNLPVVLPENARVDDLVAAMRHDKKRRGDELHFALPRRIGAMCGDATTGWTTPVSEDIVREVLVQ